MSVAWNVPGWDHAPGWIDLHVPSKRPRVLYVGLAPNTQRLSDWERLKNYAGDATVLEIFQPYIDRFAPMLPNVRFVQGDVLDPPFEPNEFDVAVWRSGPEHVARADLPRAMRFLSTVAQHWVAVTCPWGRHPQEEVDGNEHQRHLSTLLPHDLRMRGFTTYCNGPFDKGGSIYGLKALSASAAVELERIRKERGF